MSTFADLVATATSPWNDPNGSWAAYNATLAGMYETVYDIVSDQGDVTESTVAYLAQTLSTSSPTSVISVTPVGQSVPAGAVVVVSVGWSLQRFTLSSAASIGNTLLHVVSETPNFPYPNGTVVQLAYFPGWSSLLDPNVCPDKFLPYLAQFVGADVPLGLDSVTARAKVLAENALQRGTLVAVTSATQRNLTGTKSVVLQERIDESGNANAYWFIVIVRPEEVISVESLIADVDNAKPGGVMWSLVQTDGWTILQMENSQATLGALEANFKTINGLEQDRPGS